MRVLVACEFSGVVRDAFLALGHDAVSCDILPSQSPGPHYQGDVLSILDDGWDLMIAHPPCRFLTRLSACRLYPKAGVMDRARFRKGMQARQFFMQLFSANIEKICIENPTPLRAFGLPPHTQTIQPYEHGHPYTKKTLLWTKNLPRLLPSFNVTPVASWASIQKNNSSLCSKTFPGIARQMAVQFTDPTRQIIPHQLDLFPPNPTKPANPLPGSS